MPNCPECGKEMKKWKRDGFICHDCKGIYYPSTGPGPQIVIKL